MYFLTPNGRVPKELYNTKAQKDCNDFGMKQGCKPICPVYEAEQCLNQGYVLNI